MTDEGSAYWCSEDEFDSLNKLVVVFDEMREGLSEAACIISVGEQRIGLKIRGNLYREGGTGFFVLPSKAGLIVLYSGMAAVFDYKGEKIRHRKLNLNPCLDVICLNSYVILRSYYSVAIVKSADEISYIEYDGEIESMQRIDNKQVVILNINDPASGKAQVRLTL